MGYRIAAELTLILHFLFIVFVLFGGLFCLHRTRWLWLHLPSVLWGVWVEWSGWICPLTPLESHFRQRASGQGYLGGYVEQYLIPLLYPAQLTVSLQWFLGSLVLVVNVLIYYYVFLRLKKTAGEG